jgi:hypothetical protein
MLQNTAMAFQKPNPVATLATATTRRRMGEMSRSGIQSRMSGIQSRGICQ